MISEFDYQWKYLLSEYTEYSSQRIDELLSFTGLRPAYFKDKTCADIGCGNGRYTYALIELGAKVKSIDSSAEAVEQCLKVNQDVMISDINNLPDIGKFDFILSYGVLHHLADPVSGFEKISALVNPNGMLHIMVYNSIGQIKYERHREVFRKLNNEDKLEYCRQLAGGTNNVHGWWDALCPQYNHGFAPREVLEMFAVKKFKNIRLITKNNINVNGIR